MKPPTIISDAPASSSRSASPRSSAGVDGDYKICHCRGVWSGDLRSCMETDRRARSDFEVLLKTTGAGTGCGTCFADARVFYDRYLAERSAAREGQLLLPFESDPGD